MALESATYVADLVSTNPTATDPKSQGDDHLRLIKSVLMNSLAGFAGVILATGTEAQGATVNDFVVTISPAPAAYTASMVVLFKATHGNTGAATLKVNSLTAKTLKDMDGGALASGDIPSGGIVCAFYDGTDFLLLSGNDRAARAGDTYTGTHDFTGATAIQVPTQSVGDNSTKAASTAYVDGSFAPLASPALTGTPTAPTASPGTNTTQIATTAYVVQQAFQTALPVQTGNATKFLTTDGINASWANLTNLKAAKSANYSVVATDRHAHFVLTSTATLSLLAAATAGDGFILFYRNDGTGLWTFEPDGAELINGAATAIIGPGQSGALIGDGVGWRTFGQGRTWAPIAAPVTPTLGSTSVAFTAIPAYDDLMLVWEGVSITANSTNIQVGDVTPTYTSAGDITGTPSGLVSGGIQLLNARANAGLISHALSNVSATATNKPWALSGGIKALRVLITTGGGAQFDGAGTITLYGR